MKLLKFIPVATALIWAALYSGCSSTDVTSSWKAPEVGAIHFDKLLIIAASPNNRLRQTAESVLKSKIVSSTEVFTSHGLNLTDDQIKDQDYIIAIAKKHQIDGIIILRPLGKTTKVTKVVNLPSSYQNFSGYYGPDYALSHYYDNPVGYTKVSTDVVYGVETNIYETKNGELIWTDVSRTTDPKGFVDLISKTTDAVKKALHQQKLIR